MKPVCLKRRAAAVQATPVMPHLAQTCPRCRAPLPTDRLDGLCPACFLESALEPEDAERSRVGVAGLRVGEELARGGMGIVYAAEQLDPRRAVALKMLLPQWAESAAVRERFRREAQAMAGLEHPAILPVYAVGEADGLPWFTMKLATRGSRARSASRTSAACCTAT